MNPNDMQVGGNHYQSSYQHWSFVLETGQQYLEAQITRYITRWRKKDGVKDLKKALHYIDKLLTVLPMVAPRRAVQVYGYDLVLAEANRFCDVNNLPAAEALIFCRVGSWKTRGDLLVARDGIKGLITLAGPPALSEENHYAARDTEGE